MIFVTGDTHGDFSRFSTFNFPQGPSLTKDDFMVILGDFGLFWSVKDQSHFDYWSQWLDEKPWTTLFIDGNHDNFNLINALPETSMFGGRVGVAGSHIFHLKRGELYNIDGHSIFTLGGAASIDKAYRMEGISWWPEENISKKDLDRAYDTLDKANWEADYVLTHTVPYRMLHEFGIYNNIDTNSHLLDDIFINMKGFKHWYTGHMHVDRTLQHPVKGPCLTALYGGIIRLGSHFGD